MSGIKAIFFDFDDTLVGTHAATETAYEAVYEILSSPNPLDKRKEESVTSLVQPQVAIADYKDELKSVPNTAYKTGNAHEIRIELWKHAVLKSLSEDKVQSFSESDALHLATELYETWNKTRLENLKMLEPTAEEVLNSLRKRFSLILMTNGSSVVQWQKIKAVGVEQLFDHIIVSGDEEHDKPHISIFQKACSLCNSKPHECVMVGDTLGTDILGARESGLACSVFYDPGGKITSENSVSRVERMAPTHTITSIDELPNIIASL